jgi:hypothetical protein
VHPKSAAPASRAQLKIVEQGKERLVIEAGDHRFAWLLLALAIGMAGWAFVLCLQRPGAIASERVLGLMLGSAIFLTGFLALYERARFVFERSTRTLTWRRRRAFGTRSAGVPFDRIRAVLAQVTRSGKGSTQPKWRLALSIDGELLPVSVAYVPDGAARVLGMSEIVRRFIALPPTDPFVAAVLEALQAGHREEALRLLCDERHIGRAAAERFLSELAGSAFARG